MTDTRAFVIQLDHLIRLLADRPAELDDQKLALHQLHAALAHGGAIALVATDTTLTANGEVQDGPPVAADGLRGRLVADGVRRLDVAHDATTTDLLVTARALATTGGLVWLEAPGVRVDASPAVARPTPLAAAAVLRPTPALVRPAVAPAVAASATSAPAAAPLPRAVPRPVAPRRPEPPRISGASAVAIAPLDIVPYVERPPADLNADVATASGLEPTAVRVVATEPVRREVGLVNRGDAVGDAGVLLRPTPTYTDRVRDTSSLVAGLAEVADLRAVNVVLEEVTGRVERAAHDGNGAVVRDAFCALVRHERRETRQDVRLATRITIRRLVTPHTMRLAAALLPRQPDRREETLDALRAEADVGADAVMELLVGAESASDRRAYYSALVKLPADESVVLHMLGDPRWFVVRNAAELAGDLKLRGTEDALVDALAHSDPRVHRAAAVALGRLATPAAVQALRGMLNADDRHVRTTAVIALADARWPHAARTIAAHLDGERDADARHALLAALGRIASDEAVEILVAWAASRRGLLRRTPTPTRISAVQALVEARTDSARLALRTLARDGDRQVAACAQAGVRAGAKVDEA